VGTFVDLYYWNVNQTRNPTGISHARENHTTLPVLHRSGTSKVINTPQREEVISEGAERLRYIHPSMGNPVVAGAVNQSSTFDTALTDITKEMTSSLPRDGQSACSAFTRNTIAAAVW
jgi:hypothetical protein